MSHDPEQRAAAYLGAAMRPAARRRYEAHLLACERCWQEVSLAHRGRSLAEAAAEPAPAGIREDIRAAVAARASPQPGRSLRRRGTVAVIACASPQPGRSLRRRGTVAVIACASALAACLIALRLWSETPRAPASPAAALATALASYRQDQLPGTSVPAQAAPDLSRLGLHLAGAAAGRVGGVTVTVFVYRNPAGGRVTLYRSTRPFTEAAEAHELHGREGAWTAQDGGVAILCGRGSHSLLILGPDPAIIRYVGALLGAL